MAKNKKVEEASIVDENENKDMKKNTKSKKKTVIKKVAEPKKLEKALFIQRLVAFILDIFMVSIVASLIASPFLDMDSISKLSKSSTEVMEDYMTQKISIDEYISESVSTSYEMARKQGVLSLVTLFLNILYFVVFQIKNHGQTIGKKLLRIKVSSKDGNALTMNQMIFRSLIINSILIDMVSFAILLFTNSVVYFYGAGILSMIQFVIIAASGLMVMFGEKREGIHDLVAHTEVVQCDLVREMETCES